MKVKIITDTASDIPVNEEKEYGIDIMPFDITLGNESFRERVDITPQEFYEKLTQCPEIPKTSQITVLRFEEKFKECLEQGYDTIIMVLINSTGSQTYSNALLARQNVIEEDERFKNMRIEIIDSHCYSLGYGYPVVEAAKKIRNGQSIDSVVAYLEDMFNCCEIYIIGFSLKYMKKSGRINAAAAFLGEMMGLKPVISLIDGESHVVKKSRGDTAVINDAVEYISAKVIPGTEWELLRTTVTAQEDEFSRKYSEKVGRPPVMESYSGAAVTTNAGPQFIGVIVRGKARR